MPLSKKEKKNIRNKALQVLASLRGKLNPKTYDSYYLKILEKRIDSVQRITTELQNLKLVPQDKKFISKDIKRIGTEFRQVKGNTIVINNPNVKNVYFELLKHIDKNILITVVHQGKSIMSFVQEPGKNSKIYSELLFRFRPNTDSDTLFDEYPDAKVIISKQTNLKPQLIAQFYKEGITNCVFQPMIEWIKDRKDQAKSKTSKSRYNVLLGKATELEEKYREKGVPSKDLQQIADLLQVNLEISQPFQQRHLVAKSNKKALTTFRYVNTKINHVDFRMNEAVSREPKELEFQELQKLFDELCNDGTYFTYKRNRDGISQISTLFTTYIVKQEFNNFIKEFEEANKIDILDDVKHENISNYVRQGNHFNETVDFNINFNDDGELIEPDRSYNHIDMKSAYKNCYKNKYYEGYLNKIHDFRKTDKIEGIGYYTITNISLSPKIEALNKKLKIYKNGNVYPSPELKFLRDNGCKFDIIEGCWGSQIDFKMDQPEWDNEIKTHGDMKGVKWYAKYVGLMYAKNDKDNYFIKGSEEYLQNLVASIDSDKFNGFRFYGEELQVKYDKGFGKHRSQISGFIVSYTRLNMLEQLLTMNIDDLIRICVDGIYYYGDYECCNIFREKPDVIKNNIAGLSYISNNLIEFKWESADKKEYNRTELHIGAGGTGKTTKQLLDKGLIKMIFLAPSWKLATNKKREHGVNCDVWANILTSDPAKWGAIYRNFNVLVIDEISMLDNDFKNMLLERFDQHKIVMCGDPGFQLDGFSVTGEKRYIPFQNEGFDKIIKHKHNYRVKCQKLERLLDLCRCLMDYDRPIRQEVIKYCQKISEDEYFPYRVEDMILAPTHIDKDKYTERFKDLEKYYVTNNTEKYKNGEIVFEKPKETGVRFELRHAYTVHSIQGETTEKNIYIKIENMYDNKIIYTAISRARYLNQIYLIM